MPTFGGVCVKCGKCKAVCPVYSITREEHLSPRGRVHLAELVEKGEVRAADASEAFDTCLLCMACEELCPQYVPVTKWVKRSRAFTKGTSDSLSRAFVGVHELVPVRKRRAGSSSKVCAIFVGCLVGEFFRGWVDRLSALLVNLGYRVEVPEEQVCCGFPFEAKGDFSAANHRKRRNDRVFAKYDAIVTLCSTCASYLKRGYGWEGRVLDFVELLIGYREILDLHHEKRAVFHVPCHLHRGQGIDVGAVLERMGLKPMSPVCCGFGGSGESSFEVGALRIREALGKGASVIYTSCPACVLQLRRVSGVLRAGIRVAHILDAVS